MDRPGTAQVTGRRLPLVWCQWRLARLWLGAAGLLVLLMVVQSMGNKYGEATGQAWGWLLPNILPTITVIVGAFAAVARQLPEQVTVDASFYRLTFWLSAFYLFLVIAVPLAQPLTGRPPLELMQLSKIWLEVVQGVVGIALGVYFVSSKGS